MMERLKLRDVRCFRGDTVARLAPLTFLIGENSTGKSTFLALTRIAWDIAFGLNEPDFNEEPFNLGAYDELAHYHGGQGKRARSFSVGFQAQLVPRVREPVRSKTPTCIEGVFSESSGQPALSELQVRQGDWEIGAKKTKGSTQLTLKSPEQEYALRSGEDYDLGRLSGNNLFLAIDLLRFRARHPSQLDLFEGTPPSEEELRSLSRVLSSFRSPRISGGRHGRLAERPYALAPVRTKPRRTYDPLREVESPEGDHVPMLLARMNATEKSKWERLAGELSKYGKDSGLFEEVKVKRFVSKEASPFQLRVKLAGQRREANLVDVGYGVSQVLPILVDAVSGPRRRTFLMQQPEVHLHPRAQAALGSFLVHVLRARRQRFLIETHSDHIVDRARLEVKRGRLSPKLVSLLFFEREGKNVSVHEMSLDERGNLLNAPAGYRRFFLEEEFALIAP